MSAHLPARLPARLSAHLASTGRQQAENRASSNALEKIREENTFEENKSGAGKSTAFAPNHTHYTHRSTTVSKDHLPTLPVCLLPTSILQQPAARRSNTATTVPTTATPEKCPRSLLPSPFSCRPPPRAGTKLSPPTHPSTCLNPAGSTGSLRKKQLPCPQNIATARSVGETSWDPSPISHLPPAPASSDEPHPTSPHLSPRLRLETLILQSAPIAHRTP
ncbi:hypothetical protein EDC01DRAFT_745792 [Geopyxis carbonaria]|nr:hypothetical protein EDC01DRAFT_745792 [Geopyxis carbonaria]